MFFFRFTSIIRINVFDFIGLWLPTVASDKSANVKHRQIGEKSKGGVFVHGGTRENDYGQNVAENAHGQ